MITPLARWAPLLALGFASLGLVACGRYPEEGRAYHVDRYSPDASSSPVISFTTSVSPPPLLGGAGLFASAAPSSGAPASPPPEPKPSGAEPGKVHPAEPAKPNERAPKP